MTPDLRELRYFVAVAEELSFTRAAGRLHVTQSSLSGAIRQLETRVGVALLRRTTRKVELTPAGKTLLVHARSVLDASATLDGALREHRSARDRYDRASLRVGLVASGAGDAGELTLPILQAFAAAHPEVEIAVTEVRPAARERALHDHTVDVILGAHGETTAAAQADVGLAAAFGEIARCVAAQWATPAQRATPARSRPALARATAA